MQRLTYLLLAMFTFFAAQAHAEQYFTGGVGAYGFNEDGFNADNKGSTEFLAKWQGNAFWDSFVPVVGAFVNTDGGALGYGGIAYDWQFAPKFYLTPGVAIGAWRHGDSTDLGGVFEFHETLGLDYAIYDGYRVGLEVSHTSNAHLYNVNPGENSLLATLSIPFGN